MHVQISARESASIEMKREGNNAITKGFVSFLMGAANVTGIESVISEVSGKRCFKCCECGDAHVRNQDGTFG
jgi:hypothetical protein